MAATDDDAAADVYAAATDAAPTISGATPAVPAVSGTAEAQGALRSAPLPLLNQRLLSECLRKRTQRRGAQNIGAGTTTSRGFW